MSDADAPAAFVVVCGRRESARHRMIDDDRHEVRTVAQFSEFARVEKTRSREVRFPAHDAVEFGCVTARLVDLQRNLRRTEDHVEDARRALWRVEQLRRFLADARGVFAQCGSLDDFPASALIQADIARKRALLCIAVADGEAAYPAARLIDRLRDARTRRAVERLLGAPQVEPRTTRRHARRRVQRALRIEQQRHAFPERNVFRGAFHVRLETIDVTIRGRFGEAATRDRSPRFRDRNGARRRLVDAGFRENVACREAPCAVVERANAVAHTGRIRERHDGAVANDDALAAPVFETHVDVRRAERTCGVERASRERVERRRHPLTGMRGASSLASARRRSASRNPAKTSVVGATVVAAERAGS